MSEDDLPVRKRIKKHLEKPEEEIKEKWISVTKNRDKWDDPPSSSKIATKTIPPSPKKMHHVSDDEDDDHSRETPDPIEVKESKGKKRYFGEELPNDETKGREEEGNEPKTLGIDHSDFENQTDEDEGSPIPSVFNHLYFNRTPTGLFPCSGNCDTCQTQHSMIFRMLCDDKINGGGAVISHQLLYCIECMGKMEVCPLCDCKNFAVAMLIEK